LRSFTSAPAAVVADHGNPAANNALTNFGIQFRMVDLILFFHGNFRLTGQPP